MAFPPPSNHLDELSEIRVQGEASEQHVDFFLIDRRVMAVDDGAALIHHASKQGY
jgi:hypothetical protein